MELIIQYLSTLLRSSMALMQVLNLMKLCLGVKFQWKLDQSKFTLSAL